MGYTWGQFDPRIQMPGDLLYSVYAPVCAKGNEDDDDYVFTARIRPNMSDFYTLDLIFLLFAVKDCVGW